MLQPLDETATIHPYKLTLAQRAALVTAKRVLLSLLKLIDELLAWE